MRAILGTESEVPEGGTKCVFANQKPFALFKVGGKVYCLDNTCTHLGGPLCQGRLQGSVIQCPWHGSRFDVTSGNVVGPPPGSPFGPIPLRSRTGRSSLSCPESQVLLSRSPQAPSA